MSLRAVMALSLATAAAAVAAPAAPPVWRGPGWYHVVDTAAGARLHSGPHTTELACKKAMNSGRAADRCVELLAAP